MARYAQGGLGQASTSPGLHECLRSGLLVTMAEKLDPRQVVTFLSFDKDLVKAAAAEGLRAVYGNDVDPDILIRELTSRGKWVPA